MNNDTKIHKGTVIFYNTEKAYGFITDSISHKDIFVHRTGLIDPIKMNDEVNFQISKNDRGPFATNVRVANKYIVFIDNIEYDERKYFKTNRGL
jgi:cold shock protein